MAGLKLIPVVMCGGAGRRLWPLSHAHHPKQFVPLFEQEGEEGGGETLFRGTMNRVARLQSGGGSGDVGGDGGEGRGHSIIVCNYAHRFFVADALTEAEGERSTVLVEPQQRNTAPAAALAALAAREQFGDALLLLMPSDHRIGDDAALVGAVEAGRAAAGDGKIVVFGVAPRYAESDYGYIRVAESGAGGKGGQVCEVAEFCEKPTREVAEKLLARGDCYWNSGLFLLRASVYLEAVARFAGDVGEVCARAYAGRRDDLGFVYVADDFAECRDISIDYAVMERADNVVVVPTEMDWSDLGDWNRLANYFAEDGDGNRTNVGGARAVVFRDAARNIVHTQREGGGQGRLVGILGVQDCIIADTPEALLVAGRGHAHHLKDLLADLPETTPRKVFRPWGYYEVLSRGDNFQVKRILINPGHGLSLQMHHHRSEHWVVVKGEAEVTCGDKVFTLAVNQSAYIPPQTRHRLENNGDEPVRLIEVQCGEYLEEDDIVRFEDRYGRSGEGENGKL